MKLRSIELANYLSIEGPETIGDFDKINVFIGKNNSGKSNIVNAIKDYGGFREGVVFSNADPEDSYKIFVFNIKDELLSTAVKAEAPERHKYIMEVIDDFKTRHNIGDIYIPFISEFKISSSKTSQQVFKDKLEKEYRDKYNETLLTEELFGILNEAYIHIHGYFKKTGNNPLSIIHIPDYRMITDDETLGYSGAGLIKFLIDMKNSDKQKEKAVFLKIERFVKELMEDATLELQPTNKSEGEYVLLIESKEFKYWRDIRELGYGVNELLMFAAYISNLENKNVIIEEPEVHLHPAMIKKFLKILADDGNNNQYFITTHSNVLLDARIQNKAVFEVLHDGVRTKVKKLGSNDEYFDTISSIGITPSDIYQSNCVIWVEGPTDRMYINKWIELWLNEKCDETLREGLDYSFSFYGGKILSHFNLEDVISISKDKINDAEKEELINILEISRNSVIVMDSDLEEERELGADGKDQAKIRVIQECKKLRRLCWVTDGRSIEHYISDEALEAADHNINSLGQFTKLTGKGSLFKKHKISSKVDFAEKNISIMTYRSEFIKPKFKLNIRIGALVKKIAKYNNIELTKKSA